MWFLSACNFIFILPSQLQSITIIRQSVGPLMRDQTRELFGCFVGWMINNSSFSSQLRAVKLQRWTNRAGVAMSGSWLPPLFHKIDKSSKVHISNAWQFSMNTYSTFCSSWSYILNTFHDEILLEETIIYKVLHHKVFSPSRSSTQPWCLSDPW